MSGGGTTKKFAQATSLLAAGVLLTALGGCGGGGGGDGDSDSTTMLPPVPPVAGLFFTATDPQLPGQTQLFGATPDGAALVRLSDEPRNAGANVQQFSVSGDRRHLVYRGDLNVDGTFETYVVPADGKGQVNVSDLVGGGDAVDRQVQWDSAGSRLAYTTSGQLYVYDADSAGNTLIDGGLDFFAYWSVSGSTLFYHKGGPVLADADGSANVDLGLGPILFTAVGSPSMRLAPDGQRFAYWGAAPDAAQLHVVDADGTGTAQVSATMVASGTVQDFLWSPDSGLLLYLAGQTLYATAFDGTSNVVINGPPGGGVSPTAFLDVKWSPDGTRVAYLLDQDTAGVFELYVSSADGVSSAKVSGPMQADGDVSEFEWSSDSTRLAYLADQDTDEIVELYISGADGAVNRRVAPLVAGGQVAAFQWSPDAGRIAYLADQIAVGRNELFVSDADGSGNRRLNTALPPGGGVVAFEWSPASDQLAYAADQVSAGVVQLHTVAADGGDPQLVSGDLVDVDNIAYDWRYTPGL